MRLTVDLVASVAKDPKCQDLNEDAYAIGTTRYALSDGASESYDSRSWAQLLAKAYVLDPGVSTLWMVERVEAYLRSADFASLSWSRQAAFERGSFATLLGLELAPERGDAEILAIGDSLAVHVRDGLRLASFPFQHADQFNARPRLLSTLTAANEFVGHVNFLDTHRTAWPLRPGDQILLLTDAVGHWLLSCEDALDTLEAVATGDEFEQLVIDRRLSKSMRLDDSSVLRLIVEDGEAENPA